MRLDQLNRTQPDAAFEERLRFALQYLAQMDKNALVAGRYEVNEYMYYIVQCYDTKPCADAQFEAHRHYADVQYIHSGSEMMACCDLALAKPLGDFQPEKDAGKYQSDNYNAFRVNAGEYVVFLPHDCHKPSYHLPEACASPIVKIVLKVLYSNENVG